jgi:hypothetical protein
MPSGNDFMKLRAQVSTRSCRVRDGVSAGQVSTEILVLVGMVLVLLLPMLFYAHGKANVAKEDAAVQKAAFAAQRLASAVDSVGYLGGQTILVEEIEMPEYVSNFSVKGKDIVFDIDSTTGKKQIVKSTAFNIDAAGSLGNIKKQGTYFIRISVLAPSPDPNAERARMELG